MKVLKSVFSMIVFVVLFSFIAGAQVSATADLAKPIPVGATIPKVKLQNLDGEFVNTGEIINQPTVIVFYRGGWCPFCNEQLAGLVLVEKDLFEMGYTLIAISPDAPAQLKATVEKQKLSYQLYSDNKGDVIKAMGLAFQAPEKYKDMLLKSSGGGNTETILPVPAVYVVDKNGQVLYQFSNPDYKVRLDERELLNQVKSLTKK
jgi:peroxiredoxin